MKTKALLAVVLTMASVLPARAQDIVAPSAPKPKVTCPCSDYRFKPLNDKARAVAEYWVARRKYKTASNVAATFALFGLIGRSHRTIHEAQDTLTNAGNEFRPIRAKAESLGGIKVPGGDDDAVEIKLVKGVDYTIESR